MFLGRKSNIISSLTRNYSQLVKKMNVLVYAGPGTTPDSVKHCLESLRRYLSPYYAVIGVDAKTLIKEPWASKTSLIVVPGGADNPVCKELNGEGNRQIKEFVRKGGKYLGFCSGGYYGCSRVEFDVGNPLMEVSGPRELKFFPDIARGPAYTGFTYGSENGAKLVKVKVNKEALDIDIDYSYHYYNGGPVFVDAKDHKSVTILAEYTEGLSVESGSSAASAVYCPVGEGAAILIGTHPEHVPDIISSYQNDPKYAAILKGLKEQNESRQVFLRAVLQKLGLRVNENEIVRPRLTPLILSSPVHGQVEEIMNDIHSSVGASEIIKGNNDTFRIHKGESSNFLLQLDKQEEFEDPENVTKELFVFTEELPDRKLTPYFDIRQYFRLLQESYGSITGKEVGSTLLYGEVVTSTSTILDKNFNILSNIPSGLVATATVQVSGRGRGGNIWINPPGVVASSIVLDLPIAYKHAPVVFLQYLTSLAVLEAISSLGDGYEELPIKIKWPNDVYAIKPEYFGREIHPNDVDPSYVKIAGILVNTNVLKDSYKVVIGTGINLSNAEPTTSINSTIHLMNKLREKRGQPKLEQISSELWLAKYAFQMNVLFNKFKAQGFKTLLPLYYKHWLHTDQIVHLQDHGFVRAKLTGITDDYGLLVAEEIDRNTGKSTGQKYHLQPDGNSFDMFKGLISKKSSV